MTTLRRFTCDDLFTFNPVNLDFFTETVRADSTLTRAWAKQQCQERSFTDLQQKTIMGVSAHP